MGRSIGLALDRKAQETTQLNGVKAKEDAGDNPNPNSCGFVKFAKKCHKVEIVPLTANQ
jgi:hypothetical protein